MIPVLVGERRANPNKSTLFRYLSRSSNQISLAREMGRFGIVKKITI